MQNSRSQQETVLQALVDPLSQRSLDAQSLFSAPLLLMAVYSICGTHDYLNWNRARWSALAILIASGKAKT